MAEAQVCPDGIARYSGSVLDFRVSADGRRASFRCDAAGPPGQPVHAFVYDFTTKTAREISGFSELGIGPISPDGRFVVVHAPGECPMPAPVCQTTASLLDLETQSRSVILPSDYWFLMEMSWTSFGLTYFRPECAPAACTSADKAGTFRWDGSRWTKISAYRLVDAVSEDHLLFEKRRSNETEEASVMAIERIGAAERVLTSAPPEYAVAIDALGVTTFRPSVQGAYVRYVNGRETAVTVGTFSPYAFRHTRIGDWIVSIVSGSGGPTLWAYSLTQRTVATRRAEISIVALAGLP